MTREFVVALPPRATSAAEARELVKERCVEWSVQELYDSLALIVTELVANAIRHAGTDIVVRMERIAGGVRLEVHDGSTRPLRPRAAATTDEGGRGLVLVDGLSHRYGVEADGNGKRVWAELLVDPQDPA